MNSDDIAMLDTKVMPHNTVDASASIIEIIIGQHDQDGVLAHLALHQDRITSEKLESVHSIIGKGDNGVIIVDGIGNAGIVSVPQTTEAREEQGSLHQRVGLLLLLEDGCGCIKLLDGKSAYQS